MGEGLGEGYGGFELYFGGSGCFGLGGGCGCAHGWGFERDGGVLIASVMGERVIRHLYSYIVTMERTRCS